MKNLVKEIRDQLNSFSADMETSPIFVSAMQGSLTAEQMGAYLASLHRLISTTPYMLVKAEKLAKSEARTDLAKWYLLKLAEESGHEEWSENDLDEFSKTFVEASDPKVTNSIERLLSYLESEMEKSSASYLGYIFLAEGITASLGEKWSNALKDECGISENMVTSVDNHVEADKHHTDENYRDLPSIANIDDKDDILRVLDVSMKFYKKHFQEIESLAVAVDEAV